MSEELFYRDVLLHDMLYVELDSNLAPYFDGSFELFACKIGDTCEMTLPPVIDD